MRILISSIAFGKLPIEEIITISLKEKFELEFSSGIPYRKDMEEIFIKAPIQKMLHNYFPAPESPFVLNLASSNELIRNLSVNMCIKGLHLANEVGAPFFSAHSGFCVDPQPKELGKPFIRAGVFDKNNHWRLFKISLSKILNEAEFLGLNFLLENNVLSKMNVYDNGDYPLFCCTADEILKLQNEMNHERLGLLLDTGHWKVSAKTLNFHSTTELEKIKRFIRCIHHSDNDGEFDTNDSFDANYWFLPYMKQFQKIPHVIEVKNQNTFSLCRSIGLLSNMNTTKLTINR